MAPKISLGYSYNNSHIYLLYRLMITELFEGRPSVVEEMQLKGMGLLPGA